MTTQSDQQLSRITGVLLIVDALGFAVLFSVLSAIFNYPAILREPVDTVLRQFAAGGSGLIAVWYAMTITAGIFTLIAMLLPRLVMRTDSLARSLATHLGILAGLVQVLGFIRWPFLVPHLAATYTAAGASPATRDAIAVVFDSFNNYAGMAVGEHLGYLLTAVWTVIVALEIGRLRAFGGRFAIPGIIAAAGIVFGVTEPLGVGLASAVNAIGYVVWALWLIALGVRLLTLRAPLDVSNPF